MPGLPRAQKEQMAMGGDLEHLRALPGVSALKSASLDQGGQILEIQKSRFSSWDLLQAVLAFPEQN